MQRSSICTLSWPAPYASSSRAFLPLQACHARASTAAPNRRITHSCRRRRRSCCCLLLPDSVVLFVLNSEAMQSETSAASKPGPYMIIWFCHSSMSVFWFLRDGSPPGTRVGPGASSDKLSTPLSGSIIWLSILYMVGNYLFVVAIGYTR